MPSLPVGRITPIIFFVILPAVLILIFVILPYSSSLLPFFTTIIVSFSYALKRPHSIEKYLKQGLEQAVIEFETVKKIIPLILSIVIVFSVIPPTVIGYPTSGFLFVVLDAQLMFVGISGLLMYGLVISRKEFRFYFARTCFMRALNKKDIKQMYYFSLGLQEYNKYLKRHLKHQIKDIDKIFSKVSVLDNETRIKVIRSLFDIFETEDDKLKPLRHISSELMKSEDIESLLIAESLKSKLKVVGVFLTASIPIVISIITLVLTRFKI